MFAKEKLKTVTTEELNDLIAGCEELSQTGILENVNVRKLINQEAKKCRAHYSDFMNSVITAIYREGAFRWQRSLTPVNTVNMWHAHVTPTLTQEYSDEV